MADENPEKDAVNAQLQEKRAALLSNLQQRQQHRLQEPNWQPRQQNKDESGDEDEELQPAKLQQQHKQAQQEKTEKTEKTQRQLEQADKASTAQAGPTGTRTLQSTLVGPTMPFEGRQVLHPSAGFDIVCPACGQRHGSNMPCQMADPVCSFCGHRHARSLRCAATVLHEREAEELNQLELETIATQRQLANAVDIPQRQAACERLSRLYAQQAQILGAVGAQILPRPWPPAKKNDTRAGEEPRVAVRETLGDSPATTVPSASTQQYLSEEEGEIKEEADGEATEEPPKKKRKRRCPICGSNHAANRCPKRRQTAEPHAASTLGPSPAPGLALALSSARAPAMFPARTPFRAPREDPGQRPAIHNMLDQMARNIEERTRQQVELERQQQQQQNPPAAPTSPARRGGGYARRPRGQNRGRGRGRGYGSGRG